MKYIFVILFFPLASSGQTVYNEGINKVGEILFQHSQAKKDLDAGYKAYRDKWPDYVVKPMEILVPTLIGIQQGKFELKYMREF